MSSAKHGKGRTQIVGQFAPRTIEMLKSPAMRVLSLSARRILDRLEIELAHHGGKDNGRLPVTYDDFEEFGVHRHAIGPAIREAEALGFAEVTERGVAGAADFRTPSLYRLTYRHTKDAPATDEWRRILTVKDAENVARIARGNKPDRAQERARRKQKSSGGKRQWLVSNSATENGGSPVVDSATTVPVVDSATTIDISGGGASPAVSLEASRQARPPGPIRAWSTPTVVEDPTSKPEQWLKGKHGDVYTYPKAERGERGTCRLAWLEVTPAPMDARRVDTVESDADESSEGYRTATGFSFQPVAFQEFVNLGISPREMILEPILPESSLSMLYASRGIGKTLLALSIGLAVASGANLLRWSAPRSRRVLYVDGEMTMSDLQQRLREISVGLGREIPQGLFRVLAADYTEHGIDLSTEDNRAAMERVLDGIELLVLDNLSTLFPNASESASDTWVPMQNWLLKLRRRGVAVLFVHHAGTNGRQRGTSRREDVLDTVIALSRPQTHFPDQGARFEVRFEKLRHKIGNLGQPFEAAAEPIVAESGHCGIAWVSRDLKPPLLSDAAELSNAGHTVSEVATILRISRSEAGGLQQRAFEDGLIAKGKSGTVVRLVTPSPTVRE